MMPRRNAWLEGSRRGLLIVAVQASPAPRVAAPGSVTVTAGPQYGAGWLHRVMLGRHYRDLWTTPVRVEVLDLARVGGGLTPTKRGGGRQTKSLRFQSADGRTYVFRSVDKDPAGAMPPELRGTFVQDILQDQISSSHPAGALVVAPLLAAAGVLHVEPRLYVLPDDARLGEFRPAFAGMLGQLEERPPKVPDEEDTVFAGVTKIVSTTKLWQELDRDPANRVDSRAYLTARLLDVYVGDWDRHADQWRWARFDEGDARVWRPIPRDRDQAFSRLDGFLPWLARYYHPDVVSFGRDYPDMVGLNWDARALDRRLLTDLERPVWDSTAAALQVQLTDSVIDVAVRRQPAEYYGQSGPGLARALKQRRDGLGQAASRFYALLARDVDVHATDQAELAELDRHADGTVTLRLSRRDPRSGAPRGAPYYRRTFRPGETGEVRVYLQGGDDRTVVRGAGRRIAVRVIGGGQRDELLDSSRAGVRFYRDSGGSRLDPLRAPPRDWGARWNPLVRMVFARDLGLVLGVGETVTDYGFRRAPYASRQTLWVNFATAPQRFRVDYAGDFRGVGLGLDATLAARASGIDVVRFYGFGNETAAPRPDDFYKVKQQEYSVAPALVVPLSQRARFTLGPSVKLTETRLEPGTFIDSLAPYGVGRLRRIGARADLRVDARNRPRAASAGAFLDVGGSAYPAAWDVTAPFEEAHADAAVYLTAPIPTRPTLALRAQGKKVWGRYPFDEAAYVGGATTVRGFAERRFAGDAALAGSAELRLSLFRLFVLVPEQFGVFGLGDVGRVYLTGESSDRWHAGLGGGAWIAFLSPGNTLSVAYARSSEGSGVYVRAGFAF